MEIDDLIRLVEGVTTETGIDDPIRHQQYVALAQIESQRRNAYDYFLNGAYREMLKIRRLSPMTCAERAELHAQCMLEAWDRGLIASFVRSRELRDKFEAMQVGADKTEKHS